jgi:hypothetical protein
MYVCIGTEPEYVSLKCVGKETAADNAVRMEISMPFKNKINLQFSPTQIVGSAYEYMVP